MMDFFPAEDEGSHGLYGMTQRLFERPPQVLLQSPPAQAFKGA